jgi:hypothetical protein
MLGNGSVNGDHTVRSGCLEQAPANHLGPKPIVQTEAGQQDVTSVSRGLVQRKAIDTRADVDGTHPFRSADEIVRSGCDAMNPSMCLVPL